MTTLSTKLLGNTYSVEIADLPKASIDFLLDYGFKQYVADGAAVTKLDKDGVERDADEIESLKLDGIDKRMQNIAAGDFTRTVSRDPFEAECRRVAIQFLKDAFRATKQKWPTGKGAGEVVGGLLKKLAASEHWAGIEAAATANLKAQEALGRSVDLTGII